MDYSQLETFRKNENELNFLNREIVHFIVKLSKLEMSDADHVYLSTAYHSITDLERIGDYAENIIEYADRMSASQELFSEEAISEIRTVQGLIEDLYGKVMKTYVNVDLMSLKEAEAVEDEIDDYTAEMADNHIKRIEEGMCTSDIGAQYLSLASNAERVADHFINVAKSIRDYASLPKTLRADRLPK